MWRILASSLRAESGKFCRGIAFAKFLLESDAFHEAVAVQLAVSNEFWKRCYAQMQHCCAS